MKVCLTIFRDKTDGSIHTLFNPVCVTVIDTSRFILKDLIWLVLHQWLIDNITNNNLPSQLILLIKYTNNFSIDKIPINHSTKTLARGYIPPLLLVAKLCSTISASSILCSERSHYSWNRIFIGISLVFYYTNWRNHELIYVGLTYIYI